MAVEQGYPVTLTHPQHRAAKIVRDDKDGGGIGEPERNPSVIVNGAAQEAKYRALGYLRFGEAPPPAVDYHEFPKTLRHPEHVPEQPARTEARIENGRIVGTFTVPSVPAVMPDLTVLNEEQEARAREAGYKPAGEYNRQSLESALSGTVAGEGYNPVEYPKWVDGTLIAVDPDAPKEYQSDGTFPRWENGRLVEDPEIPPPIDPREFPKWVHRDGIPSDESKLANTPAEESAIRAQWKPKPLDESHQNISDRGESLKPKLKQGLVA